MSDLSSVVCSSVLVVVVGVYLFHLIVLERHSVPVIARSLLLSVAGLSLTETVFRSFRRGDRWGVKYLCLAVAGMFAYDVFLFADALLYRMVDETFLRVNRTSVV